MELPPLALRVLRRVGRVRGLDRIALVTEDGLDELLFFGDRRARTEAHDAFAKLGSRHDYFLFACRYFGPHQREPEILGFLDWAAQFSPERICEIGTAFGGTTFLLGQSLGSVKEVIGLDLMIRHRRRLVYFKRPGQTQRFLEGSSYAEATVERVRADLAGRKLDLLFIDGDHTLAGAWKDFELYRHFVRKGGIIAFHDIVQDYRTRYGRQTPSWTGDVPKIWSALKPLYQTAEFVESPDQDGFGIGALIYDPDVTPPPPPL